MNRRCSGQLGDRQLVNNYSSACQVVSSPEAGTEYIFQMLPPQRGQAYQRQTRGIQKDQERDILYQNRTGHIICRPQ